MFIGAKLQSSLKSALPVGGMALKPEGVKGMKGEGGGGASLTATCVQTVKEQDSGQRPQPPGPGAAQPIEQATRKFLDAV